MQITEFQLLINCIQTVEEEEILKLLQELEKECSIDLAHRIMAEKNGAFPKIVQFLKRCKDNAPLKNQCLKSMEALIQGYPDIVTHEGIETLCTVLDEVYCLNDKKKKQSLF